MGIRPLTRRRFVALSGAAVAAGAAAGAGGPVASAARRRPAEDCGRCPAVVGWSRDLPSAALGAATASRAGRLTSPVLATGRPVDLVGLRWAGGAGARAEVRVRRGGHWSPWVPAHPLHHPARVDGRDAGTEPVWAGGADAVQVRLSRRVRGLRLEFVNSTGTATARGRARRAAERRWRRVREALVGGGTGTAGAATARRTPTAGAAAARPAIVTRAQWGACTPRDGPSYGEVRFALVHHTVTANDYGPEESAAIVRGICHYHTRSNGWDDIGYNLLVDRHGQVFEGRAGGVERAVIGAQAQGYNSVSTGIACLGTFEDETLSGEGVDALVRTLAWKLDVHGVPADGTVTAGSKRVHRVSGHRDVNGTACPGALLYGQLPEIRDRVAGRQGPSGATTAVTIEAVRPRLEYPEKAQLRGRLTTGGAGLAGQLVEVQAQGADGLFRTRTRARTGADGSWAAQLTCSKNSAFRARYGGDATHRASTSRGVDVGVRPTPTFERSSGRIRTNETVTFAGRVAPRKSRLELLVERKAPLASEWRPYGRRRRLRARRGAFRFSFRGREPGLYRFTVRTPPDRRNLAGRSSTVHVRVSQRLAPNSVGGGSLPIR